MFSGVWPEFPSDVEAEVVMFKGNQVNLTVNTGPGMEWYGHVGVRVPTSGISLGPIYGFTPRTSLLATNGSELGRRLVNGVSFPGQVNDDTHYFAEAADSSWGYTFLFLPVSSSQHHNISDVLADLAGREDQGIQYALPPDWVGLHNHSQCAENWGSDCFNCATFPAFVGLPVPDNQGILSSYIIHAAADPNAHCRCYRNGIWQPKSNCARDIIDGCNYDEVPGAIQGVTLMDWASASLVLFLLPALFYLRVRWTLPPILIGRGFRTLIWMMVSIVQLLHAYGTAIYESMVRRGLSPATSFAVEVASFYIVTLMPAYVVSGSVEAAKNTGKGPLLAQPLVSSSGTEQKKRYWSSSVVMWMRIAGVADWDDQLSHGWMIWSFCIRCLVALSLVFDGFLALTKLTPVYVDMLFQLQGYSVSPLLLNFRHDQRVAMQFLGANATWGSPMEHGNEVLCGVVLLCAMSNILLRVAVAFSLRHTREVKDHHKIDIFSPHSDDDKKPTGLSHAHKKLRTWIGRVVVAASIAGILLYPVLDAYAVHQHDTSGGFSVIPGLSSYWSIFVIGLLQHTTAIPICICTTLMLLDECNSVSGEITMFVENYIAMCQDGRQEVEALAGSFRRLSSLYGVYTSTQLMVNSLSCVAAMAATQFFVADKASTLPALPLALVLVLMQVSPVAYLNSQVQAETKKTACPLFFQFASQDKLCFKVCGYVFSWKMFQGLAVGSAFSFLQTLTS